MWWPWRQGPAAQVAQPSWSPPARIPDGDTVLGDGQRHWAALVAEQPDHAAPLPDGDPASDWPSSFTELRPGRPDDDQPRFILAPGNQLSGPGTP